MRELRVKLRGSERRADGRQFVSFEIVEGHWHPEYEDFKLVWILAALDKGDTE